MAVNTHANPDHTFGNQLLPKSTEVWASAAASSEFDDYPPAVMAEHQKMRADDSSPFANFDFTNIELRRPDRTFNGHQELRVAGRTVQLLEVGPAHTRGDVIVYAADPGVVIAGDILFVGILPMMWQGPTSNWLAALDRIIELEPNLVIPGPRTGHRCGRRPGGPEICWRSSKPKRSVAVTAEWESWKRSTT